MVKVEIKYCHQLLYESGSDYRILSFFFAIIYLSKFLNLNNLFLNYRFLSFVVLELERLEILCKLLLKCFYQRHLTDSIGFKGKRKTLSTTTPGMKIFLKNQNGNVENV